MPPVSYGTYFYKKIIHRSSEIQISLGVLYFYLLSLATLLGKEGGDKKNKKCFLPLEQAHSRVGDERPQSDDPNPYNQRGGNSAFPD